MELIMEAVQLMENQQSEQAIKLIENHLPLASDEEKFMVAEFFIQWGFYEEARTLLEDLLRQYPDETEIKLLLADIFIELKQDKDAIELLTDIDDDDPLYVQTLLQLADLYQSEGLFEVVELKLLEAKQLQPDEPIIDFALGEFFFSIGEYKRSIIYFEKLPPNITELANTSIYARLAEAHAAQGSYELALQFFQQLNSDNPDVLFKYGLTAYNAKRKDIAINTWKRVIELDTYYHSAYYELAKTYDEEGHLKEAFDTCKQGLERDEYNKHLYFLAGKLANKLGKQEACETYISEAVAIDNDYKEAIMFLINIRKKDNEYEQIISFITDIKSNGAQDPLYDWELARAYNENESFTKAYKYYAEAHNNLQQDSEFLKEYGYFLVEDSKIKQAIEVFEKYIQLEPLDAEVSDYVDRLKQTTNEN